MRVAVLGLGLIGGSAALALEARGYDRDAAARARARERGIDCLGADTVASREKRRCGGPGQKPDDAERTDANPVGRGHRRK